MGFKKKQPALSRLFAFVLRLPSILGFVISRIA